MINAGVGGNTTEHAKARFQKDVLRRTPDVVVIQFGINDAAVDVWKNPPATQSRVSLEQYEANLRYFVKSLQVKGSRVILMTPNPMRWTPKLKQFYGRPPYQPDAVDGFNVRLRLYVEVVRKIAKRESLPLIDVYQLFEKAGKEEGQSVRDLLLDGMHPNDQGHLLIAEELAHQLKPPAKICSE